MRKGKRPNALRIGSRQEKKEARFLNDRAMQAQAGRRYGGVGVYTTEMPHVSTAPKGARVIDCRGHYAVTLAAFGRLLGIYRRQ